MVEEVIVVARVDVYGDARFDDVGHDFVRRWRDVLLSQGLKYGAVAVFIFLIRSMDGITHTGTIEILDKRAGIRLDFAVVADVVGVEANRSGQQTLMEVVAIRSHTMGERYSNRLSQW